MHVAQCTTNCQLKNQKVLFIAKSIIKVQCYTVLFCSSTLACNNSCQAGFALNTTTCTCSLSNICELSPCQNGGSCTLVSAPSNYTCDCTGTGYQRINCSVSIRKYNSISNLFIISHSL